MKSLCLATLLLLGTSAVAAAQGKGPAAGAPGPSGQDVLYFGKGGPVLLRVQVEVDGKSVPDLFRDHIKNLVAYLDRDGDGALNAQELQYLPNSNFIANVIRNGTAFYNPGFALKPTDLGKGQGERATAEDLLKYLEKFQVTPFYHVPNYAGYNQKSAVSDVLFKLLDTDGDGKLSKKELLAAPKLMKKFDLDGDEMLTAQELLGGQPAVVYGVPNPVPVKPLPPGGPQPNAGSAASLYLVNPGATSQMAAMIMSRYDRNKDYKLDLAESGLDEATFKKLDRDQNGFLSLTEVMHWHEAATPVNMVIRLGKTGKQLPLAVITPADKMPKGVQVGMAGPGQPYLLLDEVKLSFQAIDLPAQQFMAANNKMNGPNAYFYVLFNQARKGRDFIEMKDVDQDNQLKVLANVFKIIDHNADGKVTEAEMDEYFDLLAAGQSSYVSVRLIEEGHDLFQILDVNKDGKLSQRELMNAWKVLSEMDRNKDGFVTPDEFGQQFVLSVGPGQLPFYNPGQPNMMAPAPKAAKLGPVWFQKMDTNGDGDVSPSEFLGPISLFHQIDANGDGLIDADEAWAADELFKKKAKE